jgi:MFS transporter, DHA1 family, tetracycline resistance protein
MSAEYPRKATLGAIFLTIFLDLVGFGIMLPLLALYAKEFGASGFEVGLLSATYSVFQLVCAPLWGRLSDRVGRRPVLLGTIAANCVAMAVFGLARTLPLLFLARALAGIGGANLSTARAYIADVTSDGDRARGMGLVGAAFGLGFILGPFFGGILAHYGGIGAPGLAAAALGAINWVVAYYRLPESRGPDARTRSAGTGIFDLAAMRTALSHADIQRLILLFLLINLGFTGLEQAFVLHVSERFEYTARGTGYLFMFVGLIGAVIQGGLIGRLNRRFGERRLMFAGLVSLAAGMAFIPLAWQLVPLLGTLVLVSAGNALNNPSLASLISRRATGDVQGGTMGVQDAAGSLARIVGPSAAGLAYDHVSHVAPFYGGAAIVLLGVILVARLK